MKKGYLIVLLSVMIIFSLSAWGQVVGGKDVSQSGCQFCPDLVEIQGGSFLMGASEEEYRGGGFITMYINEIPRHEVAVRRFSLAKYDVTREQFEKFAEETGFKGRGCRVFNGKLSKMDGNADWRRPGFKQGNLDPVVCVSWLDAREYIAWLNSKLPSSATVVYRLPTESEWEYAARAGTQTETYWRGERSMQCKFENARDLSAATLDPSVSRADCTDGYVNTSPVGRFESNPWGLFDMLGNVTQWTEDCSHIGYHSESSSSLEFGKKNCEMRAARGGNWASIPFGIRSASRLAYTADLRSNTIGFRVAADIKN